MSVRCRCTVKNACTVYYHMHEGRLIKTVPLFVCLFFCWTSPLRAWLGVCRFRKMSCNLQMHFQEMIPRIPSCRGPPEYLEQYHFFFWIPQSHVWAPCWRELRISRRAPGADHPPLFSLVKEPKGNHISRWIPSLFICTMLITASKKDQSYLNYPLSSQPPEDSPQYENNEVKTASTFIFTLLSKWVIFVRSESFWPEEPHSPYK